MKRKILHILASNSFSGAENVACTIISNLSDEFDMAYCSPKGPIEDSLKDRNINYIPINKLSIRELRRVIKEYNPDIIHAHDYTASCYASLFHKQFKIVSHIHQNSTQMRTRNIKTYIYKVCAKNISNIIFVSQSAFDDYYYKKSIESKSIVLYNIIDSKKVKEKANEFSIKEKYDLIFLGRLSPPKNPERIIEIVKSIKNQKTNIKLAIVGDGEKRSIIEKMIKDYKLENNVDLLGFQSNPYPYLKNSKIMIMTSIFEGTPMCALEAQSLGKPIIATPVDGLRKIIKNDVNGYLSSDDNELVEKIDYYLKDNNYEKIHKNVMNNFKNINDEENYFKTICNIYKEVVNENE